MPKVKMMAGIAAISGKFGNMYFRTDKKSGRVSLCNLPKSKMPQNNPKNIKKNIFLIFVALTRIARMRWHQ